MKAEELRTLIKSHFRPGVRTNCFSQPEPEEGTEAVEADSGLLLLRHRGNFRIMSFWLTAPELPPLPEGTIVTEVPARPGREDGELLALLKESGFRDVMGRVRLVRDPGEAAVQEIPGIDIRPILPGETDRAWTLIRESFDPLTGCIPTVSELFSDAENGGLYGAYADGAIVGVLHTRSTAGYTDIRHLAVREDMRGRRIAGGLTAFHINDKGGKRTFVWTGDTNAAALKNYSRLGFRPDGYTSRILIKGE